MSLSLPADSARARSLTDVVPEILEALDARSTSLPPAASAVVAVVDGLGTHNLSARAGHARFLAAALTRHDVARTVFPSTTAAALTSLLTGADVGVHGIVGYRALYPDRDEVLNQLRGWDTDGIPPSWQRAASLLSARRVEGRPAFVASKAEYADTGFTQATTGGVEFLASDDLTERAERAADAAARHPGALVYLYIPDLDAIGHRSGWQSDEWVAALERVDAAVRTLVSRITPTTGVLVTADHGMIDVPRHRHLLLHDGSALVDGVRHIGGEPRMLHLYTDDGAADRVLASWRDSESQRSWVMSRAEAVAARLFGDVAIDVLPRIGDVLVAARAGVAYYDDRGDDKAAQKMVGQHGSLTAEERIVPLLRFGAFAAR